MLGAAQADALCTHGSGVLGIGTVVGVGAHVQVALANHIGPAEDDLEFLWWLARDQLGLTHHDDSGCPIERKVITLAHGHVTDREVSAGDAHSLSPNDGRLAPATCHDRGVTHESPTGRQDSLGGEHPVHVLRRGLRANQDDPLATLGGGRRVIGSEVHPTNCSARRGPEALGEDAVARALELRVEDLREVLLSDPADGLGVGQFDGPLRGHLDCHAQRSAPRALADTGLEHPELSLLDGELGIAHVAVVVLETIEDLGQLDMDDRELALQRAEGLGVTDTRHHVLALGVDKEVAVGDVLAR